MPTSDQTPGIIVDAKASLHYNMSEKSGVGAVA